MVTPQNAPGANTANRPPQPDPGALAQQAGNTAQDLKDQAQQTAGMAVDQVKETATGQLGTQKERVSGSLNGLADVLHQAAQSLEQNEQAGFFAKYARQAGDRVEQFADHLDDREIEELVAEVEDYARKQPAVFLGGAFVLGLLGARFLKSSNQRASDDDERSGYTANARLADAYRGSGRDMGPARADRAYGGSYGGGAGNRASATYGAGTDYGARSTSGAGSRSGAAYGTGSAPSTPPATGAGSTSGAGAIAGSGSAASRPPSAVRMTGGAQGQTTGASRVDDAERLDALRRGDVPHQAAGQNTTDTTRPLGQDPLTGQSARPGTGDTARNTETN